MSKSLLTVYLKSQVSKVLRVIGPVDFRDEYTTRKKITVTEVFRCTFPQDIFSQVAWDNDLFDSPPRILSLARG